MSEQDFIKEFGMTFDQASEVLNQLKQSNAESIAEFHRELERLGSEITLNDKVHWNLKMSRLESYLDKLGIRFVRL